LLLESQVPLIVAPVEKEPTDPRRAKVTDEHRQESAALMKLWEASVAERDSRGARSQLAFGAKYNVGSQAAVGAFLNGLSPLSLKAAVGFAKGIGCKVGDFSPRLAKIIEAEGQGESAEFSAPEPQVRVSPEALNLAMRLDRIEDPSERDKAFAVLDRTLQVYEAAQRQAGRQHVVAPPAPTAAPRVPTRKPARSR
jgi:hypothetical protein